MLRKTILAIAAAGLIGLTAAPTPAAAQFRHGGGWHGGGWHGGGWRGGHWRGGHWRGPGWGGAAVLGLGLGLATAPLWAAPYPYYGYRAYAYDPCYRRVWWRGAWHLRRVCY